MWEALRFNPITTLVPRYCEEETTLAQDTPGRKTIKAGTAVVACVGSAMFDPSAFPDPNTFHDDRPQNSYLHLGFGHHECLGKYVGLVAIPEAVRQVFLLPDPQLVQGEEGKIDFGGGPFPEKFRIATGVRAKS